MAWRGEGAEDADFVDWSGAAGRPRCLRTGEFIRLLSSSCGRFTGQCVCVCVLVLVLVVVVVVVVVVCVCVCVCVCVF